MVFASRLAAVLPLAVASALPNQCQPHCEEQQIVIIPYATSGINGPSSSSVISSTASGATTTSSGSTSTLKSSSTTTSGSTSTKVVVNSPSAVRSSARSSAPAPSAPTSFNISTGTTQANILDSSGDHDSCPADTPLSCSAGPSDTCCYEGSNGLFLQTQFWDYNPATGPNDTWTIHGLWSDKCSGGYQQFCNPSWQIGSARSVLQGLGLTDLIDIMDTNWKNQGNTDDDLWTHEFNKHGTCMSTVNPGCYVSGTPQNTNVGDFFKSVIKLWETLPSYQWLAEAGILPDASKTWTVQEFSDALTSHTDGKSVYLGCDRNNAVNEIWYFYSLKGSVADGQFYPIDSISTSSCTDGFRYLPKGSSGGGGGGGGSTSKGTFNIEGQTGCLISDGTWYATGTCASYSIAETIGGVSLKTSKGPCNVINGQLTCGSSVSAGDFVIDKDNYLTYDGSEQWSANTVASGNTRQAVSTGSGPVSFKIKFVQ